MSDDITTYLAAVEKRAKAVEQPDATWKPVMASQADIPTLLAMVKAYRLLVEGKDGVLVAYRTGRRLTPEVVLDKIHRAEERLDRLTREAMD